MSGIDWSNAPEWATHFGAETEKFNSAWYEIKGDKVMRWSSEDLLRSYRSGAPTGGFFPDLKDLVCRPAPWNGEGLPPVGTVCEIRSHKLGDWSKAKVKFSSRNVVVWEWDDFPLGDSLCTDYLHDIEIRPLRTPEQIAAEERNSAQKEIKQIILSMFNIDASTASGIAGVIADSNYRKQVTK